MEVHTKFGEPAEILAILTRHGFDACLVTNTQNIVSRISEESGYLFAVRGSLCVAL